MRLDQKSDEAIMVNEPDVKRAPEKSEGVADNFKQSEISQDSYEETVTILLQELQSSSIVQALM